PGAWSESWSLLRRLQGKRYRPRVFPRRHAGELHAEEERHGQPDALEKARLLHGFNRCSSQEAQMVIARMLVRGGLLMLTLSAAMARVKAVGRVMRSPSLSDTAPKRARTEQARSRSGSTSKR